MARASFSEAVGSSTRRGVDKSIRESEQPERGWKRRERCATIESLLLLISQWIINNGAGGGGDRASGPIETLKVSHLRADPPITPTSNDSVRSMDL